MAPFLESEDEISEIEEVTESLLQLATTQATPLSSPMIGRKDNSCTGGGGLVVMQIHHDEDEYLQCGKNESDAIAICHHASDGTKQQLCGHGEEVKDTVTGKSGKANGEPQKPIKFGKENESKNGNVSATTLLNKANKLLPEENIEDKESVQATSMAIKSKNKLNLKLNFGSPLTNRRQHIFVCLSVE